MTNKQTQNIRHALSQTLSDDQLEDGNLNELKETMSDAEAEALREENIESILLETLPDEHIDNENDDTDEHRALLERTFYHKSEAEDVVNQKILGRYQIEAALKDDQYGQWFTLKDSNTQRDVLVSFLKPKYTENEDIFNKFVHEARLLAQLSHPGIPDIHEIDLTEGGLIYYTCSKLNGSLLADRIHASQRVYDYDDCAEIIKRVCETIAYAYNKIGLTHQDIKPEHIIINSQNEIQIIGWIHAQTQHGANNEIAGTPLYMSPEQARRECADHLSDIYSIGATFYRMLTLRDPFSTEAVETFWEQKRSGTYIKPTPHDIEHIPKALLAITEKCLAAEREQRYQSVQEIIEDLNNYQQSLLNKYTSETRTPQWSSRSIISIACLSIFLLILAGLHFTTDTQTYAMEQSPASTWKAVSLSNWEHSNLEDLDTDWHDLSQTTSSQALSKSGNFSLVQGRLTTRQTSELAEIAYKHLLNDSLTISLDAHLQKTSVLDCYISGKNSHDAYRYQIIFKQDSAAVKFYRAGILINHAQIPKQLAKTAHIIAQKNQDSVSLSINGNVLHRYQDAYALSGIRHSQFGFVFHKDGPISISNLSIKRSLISAKQQPTAIPDAYFNQQDYETALKQYQSLYTLHNNENKHQLCARLSYRIARCYTLLDMHAQAASAYRSYIQQHAQGKLMPLAVLHYTNALAQTQQWQLCDDIIQSLGTHLNSNGLREHTHNSLTTLTSATDLHETAALSSLRTSIQSLATQP